MGAFVLATAGLPGTALAVPRIVFTIDVESQALSLPAQVDAICEGGVPCGLMQVAADLRAHGWAGTFFLDVYEYRRWGEDALRSIAVRLQQQGQDVALHTHPQWAYDASRNEMYQYSLDEQTAIVRDGARLLAAWTGQPVVAHRAGDYSADANTLVALERSGVLLDSSLFWRHPHCRITSLGLPRNLPARRGAVVEVPVTAYQRDSLPGFGEGWLQPASSVRKLDPDWLADADEARAAIDAAVAADLPYIVIFLHSFSFLAPSTQGGVPVANRHTAVIFAALLDHVAKRHLQVLTMRELASAPVPDSGVADVLPRVPVHVGLARWLWRRLRPQAGP